MARTDDETVNYAALSERVTGLTEDVHNIRKQVQEMGNAIASKLETLGARFDERNKTQWPTLISSAGFLMAVMIAVGTLAYRPIEKAIDRHSFRIDRIEQRYIEDMREVIRDLRSRSAR